MARKIKTPPKHHDPRLTKLLAQSEAAIEAGDFVAALTILKGSAHFAEHPAVLGSRFRCSSALGDTPGAIDALEQWVYREPHDPRPLAALSQYAGLHGFPALQVLTAKELLRKFPQDESAAAVQAGLVRGEEYLRGYKDLLQLAPERATEQGAEPLNGEVLAALLRYEHAERYVQMGLLEAAQLILQDTRAVLPRFWPATELGAYVALRVGDAAGALALADEVLATQGVGHTTSLAVRAVALRWLERPEAEAACAALPEVALPTLPSAVVVCECLSVMGAEEGVGRVLRRARAQFGDPLPERHTTAQLLHMEAVAAYYRGASARAARLWREVLRQNPTHALARMGSQVMTGEAGEHSVVAATSMMSWLGMRGADVLLTVMNSPSLVESVRAWLASAPYSLRMLMDLALYTQGAMDKVLLSAIMGAPDDERLRPLLLELATGIRAALSTRFAALVLADQRGLLPPGPVRVWQGSAWVDVPLELLRSPNVLPAFADAP